MWGRCSAQQAHWLVHLARTTACSPPPLPSLPLPTLLRAAKQQHALLCFLAMLGGVLALNGTRFAQQWPRAKWAVLLLAAANGLVGVALQVQGGAVHPPHVDASAARLGGVGRRAL